MKTKVQRISEDLMTELKSIAIKNNIKIVEASKEVAKMIKKNKNRTFIKEIKF